MPRVYFPVQYNPGSCQYNPGSWDFGAEKKFARFTKFTQFPPPIKNNSTQQKQILCDTVHWHIGFLTHLFLFSSIWSKASNSTHQNYSTEQIQMVCESFVFVELYLKLDLLPPIGATYNTSHFKFHWDKFDTFTGMKRLQRENVQRALGKKAGNWGIWRGKRSMSLSFQTLIFNTKAASWIC